MRLSRGGSAALFLGMVAASLFAEERSDVSKEVSFSRDILPILSNKCFVCHGPDSQEEGGLRLDSYVAATADRGGYRAIDPERPEQSEILVRIHSPDDPMPPAEAEKRLTQQEREKIGSWVRAGGRYTQHWAFVPPQRSSTASHDAVQGNMIDHWIRVRLLQREIDFAPAAEPSTLARRVALVLTGLPPEPELRDAFLAAPDEAAYERFVDKLLSSPRYGEHQARYWLDAVRYGDTHGLHLDNRRGIYPYRDWVVRAFNQNLPLDKFVTWQLAGDLLPRPTLEQRVATGYVRLNPSTGEGGALPEEFQAKNNFDRVETFGTVFLGMSLTCARCHTHKYDPIPQTEYYRLLAFFNSTAEPAMDGNAYRYGPVVRAPRDQAGWAAWQTASKARRDLLDKRQHDLKAAIRKPSLLNYAQAGSGWESKDWRISKPGDVSDDAPESETGQPVAGLPGVLSSRAARRQFPQGDQAVWIWGQVRVPQDRVLWLTVSGGPGTRVSVDSSPLPSHLQSLLDRPQARVPLTLTAGWHQLQVQVLGKNLEQELEIRLDDPWQRLAETERWDACDEQAQLEMLADPLGPLAALPGREAAEELARRLAYLAGSFTTSLVAADRPTPRPTHLLRRGEYDLPQGEPLEPGTLAVMGGLPEGAPRNRLGLARWLTSPEHPLVARVLMNRVWQRVFGYGLVRTPEDFGLQGEQPTHPELLDFLAVELVESGWDLKQMLKMMVTSRTFRQHSGWRPEVDDPENRLWARGPGYRLDAEVLRDMGLWASGLLDPHMGGEGIKPYQPSGMWAALAHPGSNTKQYVRDEGQRLYRRSLYVYWKRTSPHPMMTLFDAPDREASCVMRSRTNTSLQSLGLLNETQRIEMSRVLASRLLGEAESDSERLELLFQLLTCRAPSEQEQTACLTLLESMRQRYADDPSSARKLLSAGDARGDVTDDSAEHAAWSQVVITVLASDVALLLY